MICLFHYGITSLVLSNGVSSNSSEISNCKKQGYAGLIGSPSFPMMTPPPPPHTHTPSRKSCYIFHLWSFPFTFLNAIFWHCTVSLVQAQKACSQMLREIRISISQARFYTCVKFKNTDSKFIVIHRKVTFYKSESRLLNCQNTWPIAAS